MKRISNSILNIVPSSIGKELIIKKKGDSLKYFKNWKKDSLSRFVKATFQRTALAGYFKKLTLKGIGFKAMVINKTHLFLDLGFSHYIFVKIPHRLKVLCRKQELFLYSTDGWSITNFASHLIALRKPDKYKGKGVLYEGQRLVLKKGKQR